MENGLPSNTVLSIVSDQENAIWMGTRRGLAKLQNNGNIQTFELTDGLPAEIFNEGSAAASSSGIIAFGSVSGIAAFNPKLITTNQETPKLAISSIEAIDYNGDRHPVDFRGNQFKVDHEIQTLNILSLIHI